MQIDLNMQQSLEIQRKISHYNTLLNAKKTATRNSNLRPVFHQPTSLAFKALGDATGISSYDLECIWSEIIKNPNEVMATELKRVFLLAKLYYPGAIEQINRGREAAQLRYDSELKRVEKAKEDLIHIEAKIAECDLDFDFKVVLTNWQNAVDELRRECERVGLQYRKLDYNSYCLAQVINNRSKYMRIGPAPGIPGKENILADWDHIRDNLKHEHIRTLIREYNQAINDNIHYYLEVELGRIVAENIKAEMEAENDTAK